LLLFFSFNNLYNKSGLHFSKIDFLGIDYSKTAVAYANKRFIKHKNVRSIVHNINDLDTLKLEPFDLIISIGTLQSPDINFKTLFMSLIQHYLTYDGSIILGFPNAHYM
jgi:cyclopropane fatty-acyl-phospholipid synthase-like methyltransferase